MGRIFNRRGGWHTKLTPYRSGLEDTIADQIRKVTGNLEYEAKTIEYVIPESRHTYTPDFILPNGIIIESKGVLSVEDRKKHLLIQKQYPWLDIRFVFSNPSLKIYKGSKTTCASWCTKHNFKYAGKTIPSDWFREDAKSLVGLHPKKKEVGK